MLMFEYKDKTQTKIAAGIKPGKHVGTNTGAKQMQMDQILDIRIRILINPKGNDVPAAPRQ